MKMKMEIKNIDINIHGHMVMDTNMDTNIQNIAYLGKIMSMYNQHLSNI